MNRVLPFVLVALAVALFVATPVLAEEAAGNQHKGTVVSFDGKTLKMKDNNGKEQTYSVSDTTELTLDGKKSDVSTFKALKEGSKVRVTTDKNDATKAIRIEALDKNADFGKGGGTDK
jgi:hypothetical protein